MLPKRPLVRPTHTRNETGQRGAFRRDFLLCAKDRDRATNERTRMEISDESDEVRGRGIKNAKTGSWILLRMRRIRKIAGRFQADHRCDLIATLFAAAGVNEAAHLRCLEKWRLFINKRDETQRLLADLS